MIGLFFQFWKVGHQQALIIALLYEDPVGT